MYKDFEQLLQKNNVTSYQVSKDTGISQSIFTNWKQRKNNPSLNTLSKLADYFNVPIDYFKEGAPSDTNFYITGKNAELIQEVLENRNLRNLLDVARKASPKDLEMAKNLLERLQQPGSDNPD